MSLPTAGPPGPYYRCTKAPSRPINHYFGSDCAARGGYTATTKLRWVRGAWQCYECFWDNYADGTASAQQEWDDAPTLQAWLADQAAETVTRLLDARHGR